MLILKNIYKVFNISRYLCNKVDKQRQEQLMKRGLPKKKPIPNVRHIVLVASGKGGVGKSTTTVNLAAALTQLKPHSRVGILDADLFGPTIPLLMQLNDRPETNADLKMIPLTNYGIKCMSMGFLIKEKEAAIWRGLMVMQALERLMNGVDWGHLDYLLIDTPPGTSDTHLTLLQNLQVSGVILVTSPHRPSIQVTLRSVTLYQKLHANILGVIENMSDPSLTADLSTFEREHGLKVLGRVAQDMEITKSGNEGVPIVVKSRGKNGQTVDAYLDIAGKVRQMLDGV